MVPVNLNQLDKEKIKEWLESYDTILTDCDATLWHDNKIISEVPETIDALMSLKKNIYFVSNNSTKTRHDLFVKASKMKLQITEEHIIAPAFSVAKYLDENLKKGSKVYLIGNEAIAQELNNLKIENFGIGADVVEGEWGEMLKKIKDELGGDEVGAVVVGFDEHFGFLKNLKAHHILTVNPKCLFLATNADTVHKYPQYCIPDTGAIVQALQTSTNLEAVVMGKPNPLICKSLINEGVINPKKTLMIGDCAIIDVSFGKRCEFDTLLVGTGIYKWSDVQDFVKNEKTDMLPKYYIDSLADLLPFLK